MEKDLITRLHKTFEESAYEQVGIECWFARELQNLLGYTEWRNFVLVIDKAKVACQNSGHNFSDHFVDVNKTIPMPKGAAKEIDDYMLTRYACYLIAQNGDPRKETIAFAQSYFAIQTRKQELLEERIALLSRNIFERGVDQQGFGRIRSRGDSALFGGYNTLQMKKKLGVPENRPLADFLPTITIKAKDLAAEITNFNTKKNNLRGEQQIDSEHAKNNSDVRQVLGKSGIKPEELPPEEDIKKLERRVKSANKSLPRDVKKLKSEPK
jgi:DNA-damage-inducible protein D